MSCYFRHLKEIMKEAGIEVTPGNKKQIDQAIHEIAGVGYKDCSTTWKKLKQEILTDERKRQDLVDRLRHAAGIPVQAVRRPRAGVVQQLCGRCAVRGLLVPGPVPLAESPPSVAG